MDHRAAFAALLVVAGCKASPRDANTDAGCVLPSMIEQYPGTQATFATPGPDAPFCVAAAHDAIIVLGCPNNDDGTPSDCQIARADIAVALANAGYARRFIPSGAAAHNAWVEGETLKSLLVARGVADQDVFVESQAKHTDENIYFSTKIMEAHAWATALVVSDIPGHLVNAATCDSNCCVAFGRLTVFDFTIALGDAGAAPQKVGHYVRYAADAGALPVSTDECAWIEQPAKLMCLNLPTRLACAQSFKLGPSDASAD